MIGIIDSGIGGKGIEAEIQKLLPNAKTIYFRDSKNFPYGNKTSEQLQKILTDNIEELIKKGAKIIVLACNSATVSNVEYLREKFNIPIIGVVPAVKPAAEDSKTKHIALFATPVTCESKLVSKFIHDYRDGIKVTKIPFKNLASEIEKGEIEKAKENIKNVWAKFQDSNIDTIVLGCTHYPIIKNEIQEIVGPNISLIDSEKAVAQQVKKVYNGLK